MCLLPLVMEHLREQIRDMLLEKANSSLEGKSLPAAGVSWSVVTLAISPGVAPAVLLGVTPSALAGVVSDACITRPPVRDPIRTPRTPTRNSKEYRGQSPSHV